MSYEGAGSKLLDRVRRGEASALLELAVGSGSVSDSQKGPVSRGYTKSREEGQQAATEGLLLAKSTGDKKAQAFASYALVRYKLLQSTGEDAAKCQTEVAAISQSLVGVGEKQHAGSILLLIARSSIQPGFSPKPSTALRFASDAFNLFESQADKASALIVQAEAYLVLKKGKEVMEAAGKAFPLLQGDAAREASTLLLVAKAHLIIKEFMQAEAVANSAIAKAPNDNVIVLHAKVVVAEALMSRGTPDVQAKGKEAANEALGLAKANKDALSQATLLALLAKNCLASDPLEALEFATKAMTIFLLKTDTICEGAAMHTAAKAHLALKAYAAALPLSMQVVCLANGIGDVVLEASALHTASQARLGMRRVGEALQLARKSAELFHSIGEKEGERVVVQSMSKIQGQMPPAHRPENVISTSSPTVVPANLMTSARNCIVWTPPTKNGAYVYYSCQLLRLVQEIQNSGTLTPLLVCSMGCMGRFLGTHVPAQHKDVNSMSVYGVIRTVRLEMPKLPIAAVDLPTDADGSEIARILCDAMADSGVRSEVAYAKVEAGGAATLKKYGRDPSEIMQG